MRERYQHLIAHPAEVEKTLLAGAEKARAVATPFMRELRSAVGLRPLGKPAAASIEGGRSQPKTAIPSFKQYRKKDGFFYFKLVDTNGETLLQSKGFTSPRDAGQAVKRLQTEGSAALKALEDMLENLTNINHQHLTDAIQLVSNEKNV